MKHGFFRSNETWNRSSRHRCSHVLSNQAHTHTHTTFQSPALALVWKCVLEEHLSEALECVVLFLFSCSFADKCRNIYPPLYN